MSDHNQIERLNAAIAQHGQAEVARRLRVSAAQVSLIKKDRYPSPTESFWRRFNSVFAPGSVDCPVLGEISRGDCNEHRSLPFAATNPTRVRLWQSCRTCPNNPDAVEE